MSYVFPGITRFVDQAAESAGLDGEQRGRLPSGWHVKTIVGMLSSLPGMVAEAGAGRIDPGTPADVLGRIARARAGLAAQLAMIDAATADVVAGCGLDGPKPKPKGK